MRGLPRIAAVLILCLMPLEAGCKTYGPAQSLRELTETMQALRKDDVLLVRGTITTRDDASGEPVVIRSPGRNNVRIRGLHLEDARITFENVILEDSLTASGDCEIILRSGTEVIGGRKKPGIVFSGSGRLLMEPGSRASGGEEAPGLSIRHASGEFYAGLEGTILGGGGVNGGAGVHVSSLGEKGILLLDGDVQGGTGEALGGNALDLYRLSANAFVSVTGRYTGGRGKIGGDGIQVVSMGERSCVVLSGHITGGAGDIYGGNALLFMSAGGSSSVGITSGFLTGGNVHTENGRPGKSVLVTDSITAGHMIISDCFLQDGSVTEQTRKTVLPMITSSIDEIGEIAATPAPEDLSGN